MDKLKELISVFAKIPRDKLAHFFGGSVLFTLIAFSINDIYATVFTILIAGAKEIVWDGLLKKGTVDLNDFLFSILPIVFYFLQ